MKTVTVRNTGSTPLGLPGKPVIEPGASLTVSQEYLDSLQGRSVVAAWFEEGVLSVCEQPFENADENTDEVLVEKQELIDALAEHGIKKTVRTSLESLQAQLAEAEAKAEE